jgi:ATP-binding cassette subfamily C (CFTR/MRP) protein 4
LFMLMPLQFYLSRRFVHFRSQIAAITDARVSLVSQAVSGARVMKMNAWELEFDKRISKIRAEEVSKLQNSGRLKALNEAIYYFTSVVVAVFIFTIHVLTGGQLTPKNVFTTLALLNILQFTLTKHIPNAIMGLSECYVSSKRIQKFFELTEGPKQISVAKSTDTRNLQNGAKSHEMIVLSGVTCHWNAIGTTNGDQAVSSSVANKLGSNEEAKVALCDVSLSFRSNELYCVIGRVGSGKSALLQALARELPVSNGTLERRYRSLAYAAQDPWIMDGSLRENIVMGLPFDEHWYNEVVEACGLVPDIAGFFHRDSTVVGDRGVQCSGGQKARIGLARALYCDPEILLLDDPLSAVDTKVARSIYYRAIHDLGVKRGRCVVLVTHQHQFVGAASCCILLDGGKVVCRGSFADCVASSNGDLEDALQTENDEDYSLAKDLIVDENEIIDSKILDITVDPKETNEAIRDDAQVEKRKTGILEFATWSAYGRAAGEWIICLLFFVAFALTQIALLVTVVQVGKWAEVPANKQVSSLYTSIHHYTKQV